MRLVLYHKPIKKYYYEYQQVMGNILYHNGINNTIYNAQHTNCRCASALDNINITIDDRCDNSRCYTQ